MGITGQEITLVVLVILCVVGLLSLFIWVVYDLFKSSCKRDELRTERMELLKKRNKLDSL